MGAGQIHPGRAIVGWGCAGQAPPSLRSALSRDLDLQTMLLIPVREVALQFHLKGKFSFHFRAVLELTYSLQLFLTGLQVSMRISFCLFTYFLSFY
ncbi:hypothetical protein XENTR_v10004885 [Xenopus tropicalis]|nr:hypothetical protein XENTR_v10004885 [Xenopus tropicalis]